MKRMSWVIAFDFDGVLVDPLDEVVTAATQAYNELNNTSYEFEFFRKKFADSTQIIRTGKDVMPIMQLIAKGKNTMEMKRGELNELKREIGQERIMKLEEEYYKRKRVLQQQTKSWLQAMKEHKEAIEAFEQARKKLETWIVTTRDKESIRAFFKNKKLGLDTERIIDKTVSHDKKEQFGLLKEKTGVQFEKMAFFEDTIYNAIAVKELGVHVFLSTWGFSKKEQWKKAEKKGIKPIKQGEILLSIEKLTRVQF